MIEGVVVKDLKTIPDERGFLMELLRSDDRFFEEFGPTHVSVICPGVVKTWHYHKIQTDNIAVVRGMAKLVPSDPRDNSPTRGVVQEMFIGELEPGLVKTPPLIFQGVKGIGDKEAHFISCATELHDYDEPDEYRIPPHGGTIAYNWETKEE